MQWLPIGVGVGPLNARRANRNRTFRKRERLNFELLEDRNLPSFTITPTFDSSITSDVNAVAIESTINSAISFYQNAFTNSINVTIDFKELSSGFGQSNVTFYDIPYATFRSALAAEPQSADTATALAHLPIQTNNPVNGNLDLLIKTADIRALGIPGSFPPTGGFDGVIGLNTTVTAPGSPGGTGQFSLLAVAEHEIDEVLGLGSALPSTGSSTFPPSDPLPEDLYRYTAEGSRTWIVTGDDAYFSLDGTTDLAQFNQGNVNNNNGDYGDWWSNNGGGNAGSKPPARVQDAVLFSGTTPTLGNDAGHVEQRALNAIGYTLAVSLSPGPVADTVNVPYNQSISASGGAGSKTFTVTNIQNPVAGLNVPASANGTLQITGTPTATGTETFTVTATDQNGVTANANYSVTVNGVVTLTPTSLPAAATGSVYNQTINAAGGTGTLTLAVTNYNDGGTGLSAPGTAGNQASFNSTPTAAGTVSFDLSATDTVGGQATQHYTITVHAAPSITTATLATYWTAGTPGYNQTIAATGGTGALTFSVTGGALPTGLTLNAGTGLLAGTPSLAGSFTFTVTATDSVGATGSRIFAVVVMPPEFVFNQGVLAINLIAGLPNFQFSQVTTANGSIAYTFTLSSSSSTVSQTFPDAALGVAAPTVTVNGVGGSAVLITSNTATRENISLGSLLNAGVGLMQKFTNGSPYNFMTLSNFPISYAYVGRNDGTVNLYGTAGVPYNGFVSAGNYSYIGGPGLFHLAQGASSVYGYSAGQAADFAYHYSANPGSAFVVSGTAFSYMSTSDTVNGVTQPYFNVGVGFAQNTGVAKNPGQDYAYIIDSPANDTFVGGTSYSYMYSTNAAGSFTEFDAAFAFALVYGESFVGGTDAAVNNDSNKNILGGNWSVQ